MALNREGLQQLVKICPGSAGRNRVLSIKRIPEVLVPLPPLTDQRRLVARIEELAAQIHEARLPKFTCPAPTQSSSPAPGFPDGARFGHSCCDELIMMKLSNVLISPVLTTVGIVPSLINDAT